MVYHQPQTPKSYENINIAHYEHAVDNHTKALISNTYIC